MTTYKILERRSGDAAPTSPSGNSDPSWKVAGEIDAASTTAAIRKHLDGSTSEGGTFVAIPSKSFKPMTVAVEQVTKIKVT